MRTAIKPAALLVLLAAHTAPAGVLELNANFHAALYLQQSGELAMGFPNFQVGEEAANVVHNLAVFDLSDVEPGSVASALFIVTTSFRAFRSNDPAETYTMFTFERDPDLLLSRTESAEVHQDLADGDIVGQTEMSPATDEQDVTIPITAAGIEDINNHAGDLWAFGGTLTSADADPASDEVLFRMNLDFPATAYRLVLAIAPPCPADLNADLTVDASDLAVLLAAWGAPGPTDLDADSTTSASDLAILLAAWGDCD